eukprot:TRINITY_DN1322_c0_g1_i1.p2 TRINITY_DN1322_c0_g1~~TRINITY_DN1322_c0_g1_i1.p2  ORF type:complete len:127 (-),score=28.07 TRINITY_DN1322_c0_g1_i1:306-686(-)
MDSLGHCISVDLVMGKGVAKIFRDMFGGMEELRAQHISKGGCAHLKRGGRFIFYLVYKDKWHHKPTLQDLRSSLIALRDLCGAHKVQRLSIPRIGCGLDGMQWKEVAPLIQDVFAAMNMAITVYSL